MAAVWQLVGFGAMLDMVKPLMLLIQPPPLTRTLLKSTLL